MAKNETMKCSIFLGKPITIEKESGKIINNELWSETHVSGGGGGYNSPVSVNSTVVNKNRLWLTDPNGKEVTWTLSNTSLGEREGHILSMVNVKGAGGIAAYNHTLDKFEWWNARLSTYLSPPLLIGWIIILLPIIVMGISLPPSHHYLSDMFLFSLAILIGWGLVVWILWSVFMFIRKRLFTMRYKSRIKSFLSEKVIFEPPN